MADNQSANSNATTNQPTNQPINQKTKSNELPSHDAATSTTKTEATPAASSVVNSTDASPGQRDEDNLYASSPRQKKATTPSATTTTNSEAQAALKKSPPVGGLSIDKNTMPRDHSAGNQSSNELSEGFTEVRRRRRQPLGCPTGPRAYKSEQTAQVAPTVPTLGEATLTLSNIGKEMNQLHDKFFKSVPVAFKQVSDDLTDTCSQVENFLVDFNQFMDSAESRVGCLSTETNKAHKAYNKRMETLLASWTTDMRNILAKYREYELQHTTQNALKHFIRENYSELFQALVDTSSNQHLAKFDARMTQAQHLYNQIKKVQDKLQSTDPAGLAEVKLSVVQLEGIMKNMVLKLGADSKLATAASTRVEQRLTTLESDRTTDSQTIADLRAALSKAQRVVDGHQDTISMQQTEIKELREIADRLQAASEANQVVIDAFKIMTAGMALPTAS